ncbi:YbaN family protein [Castellaniella sp.]|uniref:YbaN family protein n=1 Tax=Castellaniella sp. TaxID=1955812 RepID=UPI002AFE3BE4|nr:YbaN family protein [Castellaniella sp.]
MARRVLGAADLPTRRRGIARIPFMIRAVYTVLGTISLVLGVLGIFLPLLPATPFLLLAAFCYVRGSQRLHAWLMSHRILGPYIRDFQSGRGIPLRSKCMALALMWPSLAVSAWIMPIPWARWLLLIPGIGVTIYLWRLPTRPRANPPESDDQINFE